MINPDTPNSKTTVQYGWPPDSFNVPYQNVRTTKPTTEESARVVKTAATATPSKATSFIPPKPSAPAKPAKRTRTF